jgi:protein N-terminal glutamine amidohydrolase
MTTSAARREDLKYTPNYCEENVWHLAEDSRLGQGDRYAVLLTSEARSVPLYRQKAAPGEGDPVFWDYHVILILKSGPGSVVYDFDTELPFPTNFDHYVRETFLPGRKLPYNYQPRFRVIDAAEYRRVFCSDRSHMKLRDGSWRSPPPPWPAIEAGTLTLKKLLDMRRASAGQVMDLDGLVMKFAAKSTGV